MNRWQLSAAIVALLGFAAAPVAAQTPVNNPSGAVSVATSQNGQTLVHTYGTAPAVTGASYQEGCAGCGGGTGSGCQPNVFYGNQTGYGTVDPSSHPFSEAYVATWNSLGLNCWGDTRSLGCGSWQRTFIFQFGTCRQFFGTCNCPQNPPCAASPFTRIQCNGGSTGRY
jgi:hypothetical protein